MYIFLETFCSTNADISSKLINYSGFGCLVKK